MEVRHKQLGAGGRLDGGVKRREARLELQKLLRSARSRFGLFSPFLRRDLEMEQTH